MSRKVNNIFIQSDPLPCLQLVKVSRRGFLQGEATVGWGKVIQQCEQNIPRSTHTFTPYAHMYVYTCIHVHVHTHANTCAYTCTYIKHIQCTYTCKHTCTYVHMHTYAHACTHTCTYMHTQNVHMLYTYTHMHIQCKHVHTHVRTHTRTYTCTAEWWDSPYNRIIPEYVFHESTPHTQQHHCTLTQQVIGMHAHAHSLTVDWYTHTYTHTHVLILWESEELLVNNAQTTDIWLKHTHTCIHTHAWDTYVDTYLEVLQQLSTNAHAHTHALVSRLRSLEALPQFSTHTHTHAYSHTHMHIHTHVWDLWQFSHSEWGIGHVVVEEVSFCIAAESPFLPRATVRIHGSSCDGVDLLCPASRSYLLQKVRGGTSVYVE